MNKPPIPKKIPKKLESHNDIRIDDYYWLRDDERKNKEIISYLEDENKSVSYTHLTLPTILLV